MQLELKLVKNILFLTVSALVISCSQPVENALVSEKFLTDTNWKALSLREKIGQVVCLSYDKQQIANKANGSLEVFLERYPVGSFFIANWTMNGDDSLTKAEQYLNIVSECSRLAKYPMLFVEDFEAGLGGSLSDYTELTSEMGLGATGSPEYAYRFGEVIAKEARSIGLNWLLHPVADLNQNAFNYLTNTRGLSDNPELTIKMLPQQVNAMQVRHVAATAKHFPGDGTGYINQHFNTSAMHLTYDEWLNQHGKVFQTLIDSGVMSIMAGHITFSDYQKEQLDGQYLPASLSRELMTDLLKEEMGFKGVVVSDALNMAGISGYYKNQLETEIECFKAGADVLLWPSIEFFDSLEARILRKEIPMERLNDAVSRIWNMKYNLGLFEKDYEPILPLQEEDKKQHQNIAVNIAEASLTLISNKHELIPFDTIMSKNILIAVISEKDESAAFAPFKTGLVEKGFRVDIQHNFSFFEYGSNLEMLSEKYDKFVFLFYHQPGKPWGSLALNGEKALSMWTANKIDPEQVISISFGNPYTNLIYMNRTWGRVNAYNADKNSQQAMVQALTRNYSFIGTLPIDYK